ncbi:MAG: hypothetical protein HY737_07160 [Candidatus Omnitrophica bacterium]|nr:hypothetical protein [Candidatus Omnitrophota bacterium]
MRRGMTFIELLVAIVVMIIAGVWLLGAYHASLQLTEVSQQTSVALSDAKDIMERIKSTPFLALSASFPDGVAGGGAPDTYGAIIGGYSLSGEQVTVRHQPSAVADPRELIVDVSWTNSHRVYRASLSTVRSQSAS